ncbi:MAG: tRNA 2-thiouridine(34) synthase MnmA [Emergencia sp.]|nr:tRNA 2-thiouridine(34) synthase MnmA [Emergencia sp.]
MTMLSKNKVVLGLSGGVDSTAAALLLKEKGLEVIGFYFDVLGSNQAGADAAEDLARRLDIDFVKMDVSEAFSDIVITDFCKAYACGQTPNPCIVCNPAIKFKKLLQVAEEKGAYYIATGHYARIAFDEETDTFYVRRGANEKKDQSYMLYRLGQDILSRLLFPLGELSDKEMTRDIARNLSLPNSEAADSQEICFIDENKEHYTQFLERLGYPSVSGDFVDSAGNVLGHHQGLSHYTVGQRKGLGIALGKPAFVTGIDAQKNQVILGDNQDLFKKEIFSRDNFFASDKVRTYLEDAAAPVRVLAKIRYSAKTAQARICKMADGRILTVFDEAQRAPAPGQSIVFYDGDNVLGGGFIEGAEN